MVDSDDPALEAAAAAAAAEEVVDEHQDANLLQTPLAIGKGRPLIFQEMKTGGTDPHEASL
jgi:hypothetical protein